MFLSSFFKIWACKNTLNNQNIRIMSHIHFGKISHDSVSQSNQPANEKKWTYLNLIIPKHKNCNKNDLLYPNKAVKASTNIRTLHL